MKYLVKFFVVTFLLFVCTYSFAEQKIVVLDMKYVLNESKAGKEAQSFLKKKFENENKKFEKEGTALKKEESDLIAKKKIVTPEEYKKKLTALRTKSVNYQKKKREASNEWLKKKNEARVKLVNALNPILQKYMKENNIEMIVDKKYVLLANSNFELTDKILKILDKELKSINLN